jgi:hypothetical protein
MRRNRSLVPRNWIESRQTSGEPLAEAYFANITFRAAIEAVAIYYPFFAIGNASYAIPVSANHSDFHMYLDIWSSYGLPDLVPRFISPSEAITLAGAIPSGGLENSAGDALDVSVVAMLVDAWNFSVGNWTIGNLEPLATDTFYSFSEFHHIENLYSNALTDTNLDGYSTISQQLAAAASALKFALENTEQGTCAKVLVEIDQTISLTRAIFVASLSITDDAGYDLTDFSATLSFANVLTPTVDASALFFVAPPTFVGDAMLDAVSGKFIINGSVTFSWNIVPLDSAAYDGLTSYFVGGTMSYTDGFNQVVDTLVPATIQVTPNPNLHLEYFWPSQVYAEDPFSPGTEIAQPFFIALLVTNTGNGTADSVKLTSSQPKIVDNEKGLLVNFTIVSTTVNNQPSSPSLSVEIGSIANKSSATVLFELFSTLDGQFSNYSVNLTHSSPLDGLPVPALITSAAIYELYHVVHTTLLQTLPDFLVNLVPDPFDFPDHIRCSACSFGTFLMCVPTSVTSVTMVNQTTASVSVSVSNSSGWIYVRIDPNFMPPGSNVTEIRRSDGALVDLRNCGLPLVWATMWIRMAFRSLSRRTGFILLITTPPYRTHLHVLHTFHQL